jgi:superkiller protein 3
VAPPAPETDPAQAADRAILLGSARNAVRLRNYDLALSRYQEFLRRFGEDDAVRLEYAGLLVTAGRHREAAEQFSRLIEHQPNNPTLHVALANVFLAAKDYRPAIDALQSALRLAPENLETAARLARAYLFVDDVPRALDVFDRYLGRLHAGDPQVPRPFGVFWLDLGQPEAALPFLLALREQYADDVDVLADLVRCYAAQGDQHKALTTLEELVAKVGKDVAVLLTLADALYQSGEYDLAQHIYAQVTQLEPANGFAQVGSARVYLKLFQPEPARRILECLQPAPAVERIHHLTWAEYHQLVGEQLEAKQVYREFLQHDPADYEARLALAAVEAYLREYEKAKAEYAKIPAQVTLGTKARLGFAATLTDQRFFNESVQVARELLAQNPGNGEAAALLVRTLVKLGRAPEALEVGRIFLENNPRNVPAQFTVRLALGRALLEAGRALDAVRNYEVVLRRPAQRIPAVYYGMARGWTQLGQPARAQEALGSILAATAGDARTRLLLADLFAEDNDDPTAAAMCEAVLQNDPTNLAALIRLAAAQQRQDRFKGTIEDVQHTCKTVLARSPTNIQAGLVQARALASVQQYRAAVEAYDRLLALDPAFQVPGREKARVLYSDHQYDASAAAYARLEMPTGDEVLRAELAAAASHDSQVAAVIEPVLRASLAGPVLRAEIDKRVAASPPNVQPILTSALLDADARTAEQTGAALEGEAKSKKGIRNYQAVPVYQELIAAEPANTEALFDLGQVRGELRQTQKELPEYAATLDVEPLHRESQVAQDRAGWELQPGFQTGVDFFSENGRGTFALARINRTRLSTFAFLPYGDEDEFLGAGYAHVLYQPPNDRGLEGNILSLRGQVKCPDQLLWYAQANFEQYPNRLSDRVTYDVGGIYECCNSLHLRASSFLENVVENAESLRQDIYRAGINAGADYRPCRKWDFGGNYRLAVYSDDNAMNEVYLFNEVFLSLPPCELKVVLDADYQTFAHPSTFDLSDPETLIGVVHPYFAPRSFLYYEARLEWTQWLSRDHFVHSNQCYFSLQYALGADDQLRPYNSFRARVHCDVKPWLTIGADAQQTLSPDYNATAAMGFVVIRLPCHVCH